MVAQVTHRTGVRMRLSDGRWYKLDARLFAWQPQRYEPEVVRVLLGALKPHGIFVDVGAHVGLMTLVACRQLTEGGHVYAIEPSPPNVARLRRHLELNGWEDRVTVVPALAGDRSVSSVRFVYRAGECTANSLAFAIERGRSAHLPMVTVDQLIGAQGVRAPDVIKIDVEGYEHHVLTGARQTLTSGSPTVICAIHPEPLALLGTSPAAVLAEMRARGYDPYDLAGRKVETAGFEEVVFRKSR